MNNRPAPFLIPPLSARSRRAAALGALAGFVLAPKLLLASPTSSSDVISAWRTKLLAAAEDAERRVSELLGDSLPADSAGHPLTTHGLRGLCVIEANAIPINIDSPDAPASLGTRVVLLVHGLDEPGSIWDDLIPALLAEGYAVARFDYPNDQPIADSAAALARSLAPLRARGVERLDIVAHSMGGLIALDLLTRESLASERAAMPLVPRVITLGTPYGGSPFARLRALAEARDHVERWINSGSRDLDALSDWSSDGDGQAGIDLLPGSAYLRELKSRPLPEGVTFTAIIARMAEIPPADIAGVTDSWPFRRIAGDEQADAIADSLHRASLEVGDGVVPESSARAITFDDTVVVAANHREMVGIYRPIESMRRAVGLRSGVFVPPAIPIVLERLALDRPTQPADELASPDQ